MKVDIGRSTNIFRFSQTQKRNIRKVLEAHSYSSQCIRRGIVLVLGTITG